MIGQEATDTNCSTGNSSEVCGLGLCVFLLHCESGQISKQAHREDCVISALGDIQHFTRQSAEQPDVSGPVLSRRLD